MNDLAESLAWAITMHEIPWVKIQAGFYVYLHRYPGLQFQLIAFTSEHNNYYELSVRVNMDGSWAKRLSERVLAPSLEEAKEAGLKVLLKHVQKLEQERIDLLKSSC